MFCLCSKSDFICGVKTKNVKIVCLTLCSCLTPASYLEQVTSQSAADFLKTRFIQDKCKTIFFQKRECGLRVL